jgi:hypothetical protein
MKRSRRKFDSAFKAKVAIEALKERERLSELLYGMICILIRYRNGNKSF